MAEIAGRQQTRLEPGTAWTVVTEAPLKGLSLAREAGTIFAWDEAGQLYLLERNGQHRAVSHATARVIAAAISDDGSLIAILHEGARLCLLDADLNPVADRRVMPDPSAVAVDPHGGYVAVASKLCVNQFYTRFGKSAGKFESRQPLTHLAFVPGKPILLGAAAYGMLVAVELGGAGSSGRLDADVLWEESLISNVGRLATTGDGGVILASCFTHGIQRFDLQGHNEGAYHLGGTVSHAVPDFAGRVIAVATVENELAVINGAGNVRWRTALPRPVSALEVDPLGRFLVYGHDTGEVVRLDLQAAPRSSATIAAPRQGGGGGAGSVRTPAWSVPVVSTDTQAETAVLTVLDAPARIGLFLSPSQLQVYTGEGKNLGVASDMYGVGRILRTAPGWIAAATDRQLVLFDAKRNNLTKLDFSLVEITHLALRPDSYGLAIVQERDRIGRATTAGRWIWQRELKSPVEDLAIGPEGVSAVTTENGQLQIFNPAGEPLGTYESDPPEPLALIDAPEGSPPRVAWLTLARRAQVLRGHDLKGRVMWESPVPWEGWHFQRLGPIAVVAAPDGRALAFDGVGHLRAQGRGSEGSKDEFGVTRGGEALRVSRKGVHLICSDLAGRVRWRAVVDEPLGPVAVGLTGVAALIGRNLAWFPAQ